MPPVARPATRSWRKSLIRVARRRGGCALLPELGQLAGDGLLAVDHLGDVADAVDVAFVVPGRLDQDARLVLRRDGHAMQRFGQRLTVELAELGSGVADRVDGSVALDAVMVGYVF